MTRSVAIASLTVALTSGAAIAAGGQNARPQTYTVLGAGAQSCGAWAQQRQATAAAGYGDLAQLADISAKNWVTGYLTAYNEFVDARGDATHGVDQDGLYAWLDTYCAAHPLDDLAKATRELAHELQTRR